MTDEELRARAMQVTLERDEAVRQAEVLRDQVRRLRDRITLLERLLYESMKTHGDPCARPEVCEIVVRSRAALEAL